MPMQKFGSLILLAFAAVVLAGCAAAPASLEVPGMERSEQVRMQDLRPPVEKEAGVFSFLITSDSYGIYRVAQSIFAPSPIRLLQHRAHETLRKGAAPLEVKVHHLVIYRNVQSQYRRGAIAFGLGGLVGALVADANNNWVKDPSGALSSVADTVVFDSLAPTEFQRALYTEQENPGRGSVHVIYIDTEVDGKRVLTRTLAPVRANEGENPLAIGVEAAIKFHLAQH